MAAAKEDTGRPGKGHTVRQECDGRSRGLCLRVMVLSPGVVVRKPYDGAAWAVCRNPPPMRPVHFATALTMEVP